MNELLVLFPSSPLKATRPDEQFSEAYEVARDMGIRVGLVDHDAIERGNAASVAKAAWTDCVVTYRGWMIRSEQYAAFEKAIESIGAHMFTTTSDYTRAHELPGWFEAFRNLTPESRWLGGPGLERLEELAAGWSGPVIVKDWVKSAKHDWHNACFVPDVAAFTDLQRVCSNFLDQRGDSLVGGIVLRRFEEFVGPEVRTWWLDGALVAATAHPDNPGAPVDDHDLSGVEASTRELGARFVTADVVRRNDGTARVVEVGDAQVSDLPEGASPAVLYEALVRASASS
jgi:hypothetical protein